MTRSSSWFRPRGVIGAAGPPGDRLARRGRRVAVLPTPAARRWAVTCVMAWALLPLVSSSFQLTVLAYVGVAALGALGLDLLTGYAGQISLAHGFFVGVGGYVTGWVAVDHAMPPVVWMPAAALAGALIGAAVGPFALRLRGIYLVIVTLGLVVVGQYVFHEWEQVTGGANGKSVVGAVPALDTPTFTMLGRSFPREAGLHWLIWAVVGCGAILAANLTRSRAGRAMQAVRDRDLAAELMGVSLVRYKVAAFMLSGAYAALAGGLYAVLQVRIQPGDFGLDLSIQYVAIIIIGGLGTIHGAILGAAVVGALPRIIDAVTRAHDLPLVYGDRGGVDGHIAISSLNNIAYGLLIVLFLIVEPRGLAALWQRCTSAVARWPLSSRS